ncbi:MULTISPECIES: hypothetical protein [unclassified Pseudomonas]|uniref:hypothetical protein n=1 Tax=unclassified Pseudomonas TaxID=196821 RepID=UPI000CD004AD|nr:MULTISPECIES: hypothetical protein [unclassified Pseudomonas]POA55089.1 hypothetical protein C1889_14070 [Pseudomonas sp. FW507-12TSA]
MSLIDHQVRSEAASTLGSLSSAHASKLIILLTFLLAGVAIAIHAPGQISMDTSIQLFEAHNGQSVSWSPPFMSALLNWLGGGEISTALLVLLNTILLYGAFAIIALTMLQIRAARGLAHIATWRVVAGLLLIMNPIIFIYVGIVWKDVLFASLLTAGCACAIAATIGSPLRRYGCIGLSLVLLGAGFQARQQGVFMAPILVLAIIFAVYSFKPTKKLITASIIIALFVGVVTGIQNKVNSTVKGADDRASSVGFRNIMQFDLAGIISDTSRPYGELVYPVTDEQFAAIKSAYDPSRIDFLDLNPVVHNWLASIPSDELKHQWWEMVKQNFGAYLQHRATTFATLIGLRGLNGTLPVFIGVDGNPDYLAAVGITLGTGKRAQKVYDIAVSFFNWPIYRHFFWMGSLVVIAAVGARSVLPLSIKLIGATIALATLLLYVSFLPTTIASDFRYLFGGIPLVMTLGFILLFGAARSKAT